MNKDHSKRWQAALIALILLCLTFPDVIFKGASLRIADQLAGAEQHLIPHASYPTTFRYPQWWDSYTDYGGSLYQSEPMINFMRYCLWNHQSPYWNPYSAAGQLGPETLVDQKFSLFTLINAALGGSTQVYNVTLLFLYFLGTYFIYRLASVRLYISPIAGIAMGIFYLLNGYITANTSSNTSLNYLFAPMCLYASLSFIELPSAAWFAAVILSFAALFLCTFLPTTIALVLGIYAILFGYCYSLKKHSFIAPGLSLIKILLIHMIGLAAAFLLVSIVYLPFIESLASTGIFKMYSHRKFFPVNWQGILSLFSPSLFYKSYGEMNASTWKTIGNVVFHFGIIALALMGCAIEKWRQKYSPLTYCCLLIIGISLGRIFAVPGISHLVALMPIIGNLGCQYWWAAMVFPMTILIGIGTNNLQRQTFSYFFPSAIIAIGIAVGFGIWLTCGLQETHLAEKIHSIILRILLALLTIGIIIKIKYVQNIRTHKALILSLITLMFIELAINSNFLHHKKIDFYSNPPDEVSYLKSRIGLYRTMTIGNLYGVMHGIRPELGSAYQIQEITSMNEGGLEKYINLFHKSISLGGYNPDAMFSTLLYMQDHPAINKINWEYINLLGVKYIILPSYFKNYVTVLLKRGFKIVFKDTTSIVFENPYVLPRAFGIIANKSQNSDNIQILNQLSKKIYHAKITLYRHSTVEIRGYAKQPMLVVLSDNWHPGWTATLNNVSVPIELVNDSFRGIRVQPGEYIIRMHYWPRTLTPAISISTSILFLVLILLTMHSKIDNWLQKKWPVWAKKLPNILNSN